MATPLSAHLLAQAAGNRHGLVFSPQTAYLSKSDVPDLFHVGVPASGASKWKSASGGVGRTQQAATLAAIGEGVERYCAAIAQVPLKPRSSIPAQHRLDAEQWTLFSAAQRGRADFPFGNLYTDTCLYTSVYALGTNQEWWAPHPLVVLRDDYETGIPTSSGLAAGQTATMATLRAVQELIERDALMTTWQHSLPGRAIAVPAQYADSVRDLHGEIYVFDLTPAYSPFPVVAVMGGIPSRGAWRYSLGVACRETLVQATEKAFLEWCQGVFFAGVYPKYVDTNRLSAPADVTSFDDHAMYYTQNPGAWHKLPILQDKHVVHAPSKRGRALSPAAALQIVIKTLSAGGVRLYYRDLTSIDALQAGVRVVRVLSPDLLPIHAHQDWPLLGGTAADVRLRYPWTGDDTAFPNPFPHPLG